MPSTSQGKRDAVARYYEKNKEALNAKKKKRLAERGARGRVSMCVAKAHHSASVIGRCSFDLTLDEAYVVYDAQEGCCALSGITFPLGPLTPYSMTIDRIKPELGYTKSNVRFIIFGLNALKGPGTDEDVLKICRAVVGAACYGPR